MPPRSMQKDGNFGKFRLVGILTTRATRKGRDRTHAACHTVIAITEANRTQPFSSQLAAASTFLGLRRMLIAICLIIHGTAVFGQFAYETDPSLFDLPRDNLEPLTVTRTKRQETSEICDFGSENEQSTCDWTNRNGSALSWEFGAGSLSNWLGGPDNDASGDNKGGYIFFETSLLVPDGRKLLSAFIESSILPTTSSDGKCISFNFAIDGLSAAGLRILLHPVTDDDSSDTYDRILWSSKDPTNKNWQRAEVLYTYNKEHMIVFEGVAKDVSDPFRKYRGFIAVDNVARKPGSECKGHCTFEGGFCSWSNEEGDDFQWSLGRGSGNPSTGPATDRSSFLHGGLEGGYAFIDSSYPRRPGDIALLASEDFEPTSPDTPLCLRFWTHMYGNGIGTLSVILNEKEEGTENEVWRLSGEAGNVWYQAEVPISSASTFRIVLSAKVGRNNLGDIAIDDVSLIPGSCPVAPQLAAIASGDCRFELDECGWTNTSPRERVDDMDWDRISGQATRPTLLDHTFGTDKGYFMTLARSNAQRPGTRAWFTSKEIRNQAQTRCMSFWYIMYEPFIDSTGPSLGALTVYSKVLERGHQINQIMKPVWKLYNHQGPEWRYAQLPMIDINYTVVVEGTWGSSRTNGFIAFDDITFFNGACTPIPAGAAVQPGECHFDRDACDWGNETQGITRNGASWRLAVTSRRPANLVDNTFGSPEGYVYFDLFNHNAASNIVRLISPPIPASGEPICMAFWFAAFGAGEDGNLKILREDNTTSGSPNNLVWELSAKDVDTARPSWTPAQMTLDASSDFRVVMEGMATNGGFAVDDIVFSVGPCQTRPVKAAPVPPETT